MCVFVELVVNVCLFVLSCVCMFVCACVYLWLRFYVFVNLVVGLCMCLF